MDLTKNNHITLGNIFDIKGNNLMAHIVTSHSQQGYTGYNKHKEVVMHLLVYLKFGHGDFQHGFKKSTLSTSIGDRQQSTELEVTLPPAPNIPGLYQNWQNKYSLLVETGVRKALPEELVATSFSTGNLARGFSKQQTTNFSYYECQEKCNQYAEDLCTQINQWLAVVKSQLKARVELNANSDILLIINTENLTSGLTRDILHRLPWQEWDYFDRSSAFEAVLCLSESQSSPPSVVDDGIFRRVRITSIFGDSTDIDVAADKELIAKLQKRGAELINLEQPQRQDFIKLWDEPCDILFYSGHSESCFDGTVGSLQINSTESLNLQEIRNTFREAIKKGLKLAIFNSCDGLGLAKQLADLHLPYIIVWREPVPDKIAQTFLEYFLNSYAEGKSLFNSVRDARIKLVELTNSDEKEKQIPGLKWLPIICKNTSHAPPTWEDLGGLTGKLPNCPYQGLSAFGEENKDFFFGRDDVIADLVEAVNSKPLVPVIGASGSGKSSVVFAGLVPQLRNIGNVQIVSFRPGKNPFDALAIALTKIQNIELNNRLEELKLGVNLEHDEKALCELIEHLNDLTPQPPSLQGNGENLKPLSMSFGHASLTQERGLERGSPQRFVLIADQFEELYTLTEDSLRQSFLDLLLYTVQNAPAFSLLLTLRADFLGKALDYQPMGEAFKKYPPVLLTPMKPEELQAAIAQPAAKLKVELEQGLTGKLIDDLGNQPGRLPLLEFTLSLLWEKHDKWYLTHKAYEEIGGLEKALAKYADGVLNPLSAADKEKAERIFIQLIRPGEGTEDTKRKATRGEVGEDNWDLVEFLANHRLLVTGWDESGKQETVEIIHEALIREWGMLREWIKRNREFRIWQERLKPDVRQWENKKYDAQSLLQGTRLAIALDWLKQRADELTSLEQDFISASVKHRDKERSKQKRRRQLTVSGLVGGLMLVSTFAGISEIRRIDAEAGKTSTVAENFFTQNDHEVALTEAIKAGKLISKSILKPWVAAETKMKVVSTLREAVYGYQVKTLKHGKINSFSFSPDGKTIASASYDGTLKLWNSSTGKEIKTFKGTSKRIDNIFFPDGKTIITASHNTVKLWDITTEKEIKTHTFESDTFKNSKLTPISPPPPIPRPSIRLSSDGKIITYLSSNGILKQWDRTSGKEITNFQTSFGAVMLDSLVSSDANIIVSRESSPNNERFKLWDSTTGKEIKTLEKYAKGSGSFVGLSPDNKTIALAFPDKSVKLLDIATGKEIKTFKINSRLGVSIVIFSPDGKTIALAFPDNSVKLLNIATGKEIKTFKVNSRLRTSQVIFSPNGKTIALASQKKTRSPFASQSIVKLLDIETGKEIKTFRVNSSLVRRELKFSPNSKTIAFISTDAVNLVDSTTGVEIETLEGHSGGVTSVSFSPNGKNIASASHDGTVKLWDRINGREIKTLKDDSGKVINYSFSPDGKTIAFPWYDNKIKIHPIRSGQKAKILEGHKARVNSISFSPNGKTIASASYDQTIKIWDATTGKEIKTFKIDSRGVNSLSFSANGSILASASADNTVKLWDVTTGKEIKILKGHLSAVNSISFSPDDKTIASASGDNTIKLWDANTEKEIKTLKGHSQVVNSVSFSPDGKIIASASGDKTVKLWDSTTGKEIKTLKGHSEAVNSISFSPDGKTIVSASNDKTLKLWDVTTGKEINKTLRRFNNERVVKVNFSLDGKTIHYVTADGMVTHLYIDATWEKHNMYIGATTLHFKTVCSVIFSPDGNTIASASNYGVNFWDSRTGEIKTFKRYPDGFYSYDGFYDCLRPSPGRYNILKLSPNGKTIASASGSKTIKLWDISTGRVKTFEGHSQGVTSISFSPDGKTIASGSADKTIKLWDISTGREIKTFRGHYQSVSSIGFSPDGKTIASGSADKTIKLWDISTGREIKTFRGNSRGVKSVSFSPDGKTIVSAPISIPDPSPNNVVKLWDINTGREITTLQVDSKSGVESVSFSPDGKTITSVSDDGTVILWNFDLESLLNKGCNLIDDYLQNNSDVNESDKRVCDGIN